MALITNSEKMIQLRTELDKLKILETENDYLTAYFERLKDQVDFPFFIKAEIDIVPNVSKLNENWQQITNKVKQFAQECKLKRSDRLDQHLNHNIIQLNNETDLNLLEKKILDFKSNIERDLFQNRSIIFLDRTNSDLSLFKQMDHETTVGKLILVTNSYLGSNAAQLLSLKYQEPSNLKKTIVKYKLLINCDKQYSAHETEPRLTQKEIDILKIDHSNDFKLTNEFIKCKHFHKWLFNNITDNQLVQVPLDLNSLTHLDLSNNELASLETNLFKDLVYLETVWLCNNKIEKIHSDFFNDLIHLKHLSLSNNRMEIVNAHLFKSLTNLTHLFLANNKINSIDREAFKSLRNLTRISLLKNCLTSIEDDIFTGLSCLKEINLSENQLTHLNSNQFRGLSKMIKINLSHNNLIHLDSDLFSGLVNLEAVYLSDNQLVNVSPSLFYGLEKISYISLHNNKLESVDKTLFNKLSFSW